MIQSIDRAMQIITVLISDDSKSDWAISELAERTMLPFSTLHRILHSLIQHGLVAQVPETKFYKLGYKWMEIGLRLMDKMDFRMVARPIMERLAVEVEESIFLNIPDESDGIVVEKIDSPLKLRIAENLGFRIPLNIGAPNKTILAHMKPKEVEQIMNRLQLTQQEIQLLLEQLVEIKRKKYAISYGEKTEGTACFAAPIIGYKNQVVAAISINLPVFRLSEERMPLLIEKVKEAAEEISIKIGK